uniref:RING-type domain-containing protein n=1 Tax=Oryza punctata TaxID=4537 RepID=A0A0E0M327_ORYPU
MEARAMPPPPRRGVTLAEQMAASSNLRDLLKLRDDDVEGGGGRRQPAATTAVVAGRRRTLLDVIRGVDDDDDDSSSGVFEGHRPATSTRTAAAPRRGRVSLMALLEQAERQWATAAGDANRRRVVVDHAAAASEEGTNKGFAGAATGVGGRCCVCMARGKGAAFIPCGHTFCRACARELRAGRGRCPLCNAAIHDVLNLF